MYYLLKVKQGNKFQKTKTISHYRWNSIENEKKLKIYLDVKINKYQEKIKSSID